MKIASFDIFRFRLKLRTPLQLKNKSIDHREGLLIRITSESGSFGVGEVSPLPMFSGESIDDALKQLLEIKNKLLRSGTPQEIEKFVEIYHPSVRFGVETALINITAHSKSLGLSSLINRNSSRFVKVNGLLSGSSDEVINKFNRMAEVGYDTFKLKVGRRTIQEDVLTISKMVESKKNRHCLLRLDANRSLSLEQFNELTSLIPSEMISYIEEPFATQDDLIRYINNFDSSSNKIKIALDESLLDDSLSKIENYSGVAAFVIKPTMHGFTKSMSLVRKALELNITPVISSSYESSFGILTLAQMAAIINGNIFDIAVGLDTLDVFEETLCKSCGKIENARIDLTRCPNPTDLIIFDMLEEMSDV